MIDERLLLRFLPSTSHRKTSLILLLHLCALDSMATNSSATAPYADEWLAFEQMTGGRFVLQGSIADWRQQFDGLFGQLKSMLPPPDNEVTVGDSSTPEGIKLRSYRPNHPDWQKLPIGLYIHSGGWCLGSIDHEDHLCRQLVTSVPCQLMSVEYRLAPEHPYPAALDDCVAAYKHMVETLQATLNHRTKTFIVGGSAGGHLTLATALRLIEEGYTPRPSAIYALCPSTCMIPAVEKLSEDLREYKRPDAYGDAAFLSNEVIAAAEAAFSGETSPDEPYLSPLFHRRLDQLPLTYVTTSNKDPLHDDANMLHHKLEQLGVANTLKQYDGYAHFFHMLPMLEASQRFMADLAQSMRDHVF